MDASRNTKEATRLLPLVERVLDRYPFDVREVAHLATHSNVLYRVVTEAGEQRVLRVGTPHANTTENIKYEVAWLDALNRNTSLDVVHAIPTTKGALIVEITDPELDEKRPCVLFSWVPGTPMGDGSGTFGYRLMGQMSAALRNHGQSWRPADINTMRRWDTVFYYNENLDPVIFRDPSYGHLFDAPLLELMGRALPIAESVIRQSWASGTPHVVHGDLHEWNVHLVGSRLYAFDFEDVMVALPAQDAAISLYHSRNQENKVEARKAFRSGYESVAPWPIEDDRQLDGFHAARQIMLMNYAARTLPTKEARDFFDRVTPWLDGFAKRYG